MTHRNITRRNTAHRKTKAIMLATATAALFSGGMTAEIAHADEAKVHCGGITSCKGTSDCATAENSCQGMNSCKGHGFKTVTKSECEAKGGKILK